jgi:hypothetical protein
LVAKISSYFLVLCVLFSMSAAFGQVGSSVTGTVSDSTGAVIPNASLELKNQDTGAVFASGTSATGNYTIVVPPGTYELTVTQKGFKKAVQKNLIVGVATSVRQDFQLAIGEASEVVTVVDAAPLLKTESADISHIVDTERADNLPVLTLQAGNIRNPLQMVNLLAGASFSQNGAIGSQMVRINGLPSNTQAIRIEGQDATNGIWKEQTQIAQSSVDAIQEVAIQTSNYAAEYGQAGGGYFNFTMKSGTNAYHVTSMAIVVNEFMNAGMPNTNAGATQTPNKCYAADLNSLGVPTCYSGQHVKNSIRQLDYDVSFGGPIKIPKIYDGHDKTFFFVNFEQYRNSTFTGTGLTTVPTDAYRSGDFTQAAMFNGAVQPLTWTGCTKNAGGTCIGADGNPILRNAIYDPLTNFTGPDGNTYRQLFAPFNVIPLTRMDPVAIATQNLLPQPLGPNATALINNYNIPGYSNFKHTTNPSVKIDHSISSTVKISGYYSQTNTNSPNANGFNSFPFESVASQADVSRTIRVNYDQTLTPTLLFHVGAGYLWTYNPSVYPPYNPAAPAPTGIGLVGFTGGIFPNLAMTADGTQGGNGIALGAGGGFPRLLWEEKPTGNSNLTWIKNNHTFKLGLDLTLDGFVHRSPGYANGNLSFNQDATGLPAANVNPIATHSAATAPGFAYASFLLGQVSSESVSGTWAARIGQRAIGMYLQDTWKLTRKLTLDYGLRYDYQTYLKETYGRLINVGFDTPNPTVANRLGAVIFEGDGPGRCNCTYGSNYPYAIGPRVGVAYQINSKTVLRIGGGLSYGPEAENAQLSYNIGQAATIAEPGGPNSATTAWPVVNAAGNQLVGGNPYRVGNPYGNTPVTWPNFNPGQYPTPAITEVNGVTTTTYAPSGGPLTGSLDRNLGRPPRILSWSAGLQREIRRDLVVEAAYVGNRGVWWTAPALSTIPANAYTAQDLLNKYGLNINQAVTNPTTGVVSYPAQTLLTSQIGSTTAINAGFGTPAYPGMPLSQTVGQQLRPYPQFTAVNPFLGPPLGQTWYDSLQTKVTKRYSHGLDLQAAFTWQKELSNGSNSSTSYFTPGALAINDIFNTEQNKSISSLSQPFQLVISGSYTTPRTRGDGAMAKMVSQVLRDWQLGVVLRYQSGSVIQIPASSNNLFAVLARTNLFYALATPVNRVAGVSQFATFSNGGTDPNCKCFDPNKQLVLNPAAYVDPGPGNFGSSSSFINTYRWMRQPAEAMSFARNFKMGHEGKYNLQIRGEFQNVFNRRFYAAPAGFFGAQALNTPTTFNTTPGSAAFGSVTGGLGYVNAVNGAGAQPRSGQAVARFTF